MYLNKFSYELEKAHKKAYQGHLNLGTVDAVFSACFQNTLTGTERILDENIAFAIENAFDGDPEVVLFSVTTEEPNYKQWLDAVEGYPGVVIYPIKRYLNWCDEYTAYFCIVPKEPRWNE